MTDLNKLLKKKAALEAEIAAAREFEQRASGATALLRKYGLVAIKPEDLEVEFSAIAEKHGLKSEPKKRGPKAKNGA